jgi:site-specific DNA-cytosine methylase
MKDVLKQNDYGYLTDFAFPNRNQKCPSRTMDQVSMTLTTMKHFYLTPIPIFTRKYLPKEKHIWLNKTKDGLDNGMPCREITNQERALLQGFPEDYQFYGSNDSIRKQIGNAVPPPLIKAFFSQIILTQPIHSTVERK